MSVNGMRTARIHILVTFDSLSIFQISGRIVYFSLCKKINKKIIIKKTHNDIAIDTSHTAMIALKRGQQCDIYSATYDVGKVTFDIRVY